MVEGLHANDRRSPSSDPSIFCAVQAFACFQMQREKPWSALE